MQAADFKRLLRGRPTWRLRGDLYHARPLMLAGVTWGALVACRLSEGPLPSWLVVLLLALAVALLGLCRMPQAQKRRTAEVPSVARVACRIIFLALALGSVYPMVGWLTHHHD